VQQDEFELLHQDLPAQLLNVQIVEVIGLGSGPINDFFNGDNPVVRTINLRDTEAEDDLVQGEVVQRQEFEGEGTGVADTKSFDADSEGLSETVDELKETVRFQYDGVLKMELSVNSAYDELTCTPSETTELTDPTIGKSFHVVNYMAIFFVRLDLQYEIIPGVFCDIVDEDTHQIEIINNVGMDDVAGFDTFYNALDANVQDALAVCSTIAPDTSTPAQGACLENVQHNKNGKKAGLDFRFAAGRPNPFASPYTKNINFKVIGGVRSVQHFSEFFIQGMYSKGSGNSFALPTHEPIMILRDPPGMQQSFKHIIY